MPSTEENLRPSRRRTFSFQLLLAGLLLAFVSVTAAPGSAADGPLPALEHSSGSFADLDQDGLMDVLLTGSSNGVPVTRLYLDNGNGTFHDLGAALEPLDHAQAAWGDFDNDGDLDLALAGQNSQGRQVCRVYRNEGQGVFTDVGADLLGVSPYFVSWVDFDRDGDLDLYISGYSFDQGLDVTQLYRNDRGRFTPQKTSPADLESGGWGDFDGDGIPDLITASRLLKGQRDGTFQIAPLPGAYLLTAGTLTGDFDGDGALDFLVRDPSSATPLLLHNNGTGSFTPAAPPGNLDPDLIRWGDFDNDGTNDILIATRGQSITVYASRGPGWSKLADLPPVFYLENHAVDWVDIDNDGDLDLFHAGYSSIEATEWVIGFYTNTTSRKAVSLPPPANLRATFQKSDEVLLAWDPPASGNPAGGMGSATYNLRAGLHPAGIDAVSPQADATTGRRWLQEPGNAGPSRQCPLRVRQAGTYHWSVQSISAAFLGSPFASEATFVVTNTRPLLSTISNLTVIATFPSELIPFSVEDGESPPGELEMTVTASDPVLFPDGSIRIDGTGTNRVLRLLPAGGGPGVATILLRVTDPAGAWEETRFDVAVVRPLELAELPLPGMDFPLASWVDLDNDGDLDLYLAGLINGSINYARVFRNDRAGSWVEFSASPTGKPLGLPYARSGTVRWEDFDHDGRMDLLVGGPELGLYRNNGDNSFTPSALGPLGIAQLTASAWADFDGDGQLDFAACGLLPAGGLVTQLYHNNGHGGFTLAATLPSGYQDAAGWGDFDNDGDPDLLVTGAGQSHLYRNDGGGIMTEVAGPLPPLVKSAVAWEDYNQDGWLDFTLSGLQGATAVTLLYRNNGDGTFTRLDFPFVGVRSGQLAWADVNGDGYPDLLAEGIQTDNTYSAKLYMNEGGAGFVAADTGFPPITGGRNAWGDMDQDGDPDLVLLGSTTTTRISRLFRNQSPRRNAVPGPPEALAVELQANNNVRLTWSAFAGALPGVDAGLSYDVRIGTTPGGIEVLSPPVDPVTGLRRVAQRGTCQRALQLGDLPKGEYHWSVQAVNAAFIGSAFAPEGRFSITNARPVLGPIGNAETIPDVATAPLPLIAFDEETPPEALRFIVTSSNAELVPPGNVVFSGSGSNSFVQVLPTNGLVGLATITVTLSDAQGLDQRQSFTVHVQEFSPARFTFPRLQNQSMDWGDYDNDGDLDLIMLGFPLPGQPSTLLFRNEGGGVFTVLTNGLPQLDDGVVRWGDYNGDGLLDLLIAGGQQSFILKGHGDGTFSDIHAPLTIRSRLTAAWVDIDGDGDLDVHLESGLFRNDGHDVFTRVVTSFENLSTVGFAWGDFDNDGDLDVITSFPTANGLPVSAEHVRLFLNLGSGTFMDGGGGFPAAQTFVTAGDLNQDGYLDVVVGGFDGSGGNAVVYTNTQRRTFAPVPGGALAGVPKGMAVLGDYDNDGFLDVLVSQSRWRGATIAHLYRNNRNGTYSTLDFPLVGGESGNPTWADYDNDGRLDLLLPSAFPLLLHNNMPVRNVAPAPPSGLRAAVGPTGEVRLEWDPANDGATPASLRYNLRVGTRPGTEDVMAASADPVTGHRRLADFGNAGTTRFWRLRLPAGSYYWSVQAIDAGMAGSPFAAESSFTITAPGFTRIAVLPGGARRLSFTNAPGSLCLISASTNLALSRWLPLGPASETSPGSFEFIDPQPMSSHRFYRVQSP